MKKITEQPTSDPSAVSQLETSQLEADEPAANEPADQKPIYFISGLGADERIFQWLRYDGYRPVHLHWIAPERGEAIEAYAQRLAEKITDPAPIIVGLSFGGMMAVEIAKQIDTHKVILISSIKETSEVPFYFKFFRALPLHRIFPFKSLLWAFYWLTYWLFSPEGMQQKQLLKTVLIETEPHFLKWALHKVVVWKNKEIPKNLVHIHGKGDRIFPYRFVSPSYTLDHCGHLMVMNRAEEVSNLLDKVISDL